jgi:hypothetical protein
MSPWPPEATVAIEYRRFWEHDALDEERILRAVGGSVPARYLARLHGGRDCRPAGGARGRDPRGRAIPAADRRPG